MTRIGHGYDLHRLEPDRRLIVGGVELAHGRGAVAHSDGDVVYHAVVDAVLGALGQGDIGELFPDDDPTWRAADSAVFLREAARRLKEGGYQLGNLDVTVILEQPKLKTHKPAMRDNLAAIFACDSSRINVKSKTNEKVDALGENRAMACHAVVSIKPIQ